MTLSPLGPRGSFSSPPYPQPLHICAGPSAESVLRQLLAEGALPGARLYTFTDDTPPELNGPAILVIRPADLRGPHREKLFDLAHAARPGRPVLYGGTGNREVLMDAINTWRIFRVVPEGPRAVLLADAIRKAHDALELACSLELGAADLRRDTEKLEQALRDLRGSQEKTRHAERLATLGRITKSLIPVIAAHLDALQDFNALVASDTSRRDARLEELLGYAFTGIRSLHAMLDEIRSYAESRPEAYQLVTAELDELVRHAVAFSRYDPQASHCRIGTQLKSRAKFEVDAFRMHQVIINLVRNAVQATPEGGEVTVRTGVVDDNLLIQVENTGEPIPAEIQAHLFEPFFTTKGEGGMGLGLSMCKAAVERHGGKISCSSGPGQPTCFTIRLPRPGPGNGVKTSSPPTTDASAPVNPSGGKPPDPA
jgi:signal transduction histidine kinase